MQRMISTRTFIGGVILTVMLLSATVRAPAGCDSKCRKPLYFIDDAGKCVGFEDVGYCKYCTDPNHLCDDGTAPIAGNCTPITGMNQTAYTGQVCSSRCGTVPPGGRHESASFMLGADSPIAKYDCVTPPE